MRHTSFLLALVTVGCVKPDPVPPKRPNTELISGSYERREPELAIKFMPDGGYRIAPNRTQFDVEPPLGTGTYTLEEDTLILEASTGMCADTSATKTGTFKIVLSKIGIRWTKISDTCVRRAKFDGQTFWRVD